MQESGTILAAIEQIRSALNEYTIGWDNTAARKIIEAHVRRIRDSTSDGYILEKTASISSLADVLFSARKHQKYGGPDRVKAMILDYCSRVENRTDYLKSSWLKK